MSARLTGTLLAIMVLAGDMASAQQPDPRFRPRYSFASVRLHRHDTTEFNEQAPDQQLLDRWHTALVSFREVAALVAEQKFSAAGTRLNLLARELPSPYREYASRFQQDRLDALIRSELRGFKPFPSYRSYLKIGQLCCDLGDRELGVRLLQLATAAGRPQAADMLCLADDYRPFALTELELTWLEQALTHPAAVAYLQTAKAELQAARLGRPVPQDGRPQPSLGMVLSALDAQHQILTANALSDDRLRVYNATIAALGDPAQQAERDAWQTKLLIDFRHAHESCARVYFDRGQRSYHACQKETALVSFQKICRHHALSSLHGRALYHVGLILQERHQYNEAIDAYERVFPTSAAELVTGEFLLGIPDHLRHVTAQRLAECYEERHDLHRAWEWVAAMKSKYPASYSGGFCDKVQRADEQILEARLLAKLGRTDESLQILESSDEIVADEATGVARILVDRFHRAEQLPALEKRLAAVRRAEQPRWVDTARQAIAKLRTNESSEFRPFIWSIK